MKRIRSVAQAEETTFVITNNHFEGKAVVNGLQVIHLLTKQPVAAPAGLLERYPELERISDASGTMGSLFWA